MIIAVNTRLRKDVQPEGYENFLFAMLEQVTAKNPQHLFLFIFDKPFENKYNFAKNIQTIIAGPETSSTLRLQYWLNFKIPALLRKYKTDVFVSMEGICSLRTKTPQCLLIPDLIFLQAPQLLKKSQASFYKKHTPGFLAKANGIATVSDYSKSILVDKYKLNEADVAVIKPGIDTIFKPAGWNEKEAIKEKYADGKAYFLFSGEINSRSNTINLLKAFTLFKKRQKSNMLLLIAGNAGDPFKTELKTYAFRNEVKLLEDLSPTELAQVTAAAYALVYPVFYDDLALPVLQAMQCGVPVVCSNAGPLPTIFADAALYADANNVKDIAENMMLVFKDEDKAKAMVQAGNTLLSQHRWDNAADLLMQLIRKAAGN